MTGAQLLVRATRALVSAGVPEAARDARRLLAHALDMAPGRLTLVLGDEVEAGRAGLFDGLIAQRAGRVPVSQLTGRRMFYGREFIVTPDVLDPRPETETLIAAALAQPFGTVLDLGTGTGCILLTLMSERAGATGTGTDLSEAALAVAARNRTALGLEDRVALVQGSWFSALDRTAPAFDLVVCNPPYIAAGEMPALAPEVRLHEPRLALTDEGDGLAAYREILSQVPRYLAPGGRVLLEIGPTQGRDVGGMMAAAGLARIAVLPDLDGRDRVVSGAMPPIGE